jgi:N-acetylmuramoyl-L-alanine amidase
MTVILDPGHGMSNRRAGVYDPGAVGIDKVTEAEIVMEWANEIRAFLRCAGHKVVRTRINAADPAPVGQRAGIAKEYKGEIMLSLHCNAFNGTASGTETFYRGEQHKAKAQQINVAVVKALGTKDRGVKTEGASQHSRLAVMAFQPCFLLEIGFIDNPDDFKKMTDPKLRAGACEALARVLTV